MMIPAPETQLNLSLEFPSAAQFLSDFGDNPQDRNKDSSIQ